MPQAEPVLSAEDHYLWNEVWVPALRDHAQTRAFRRHLAQAKDHAALALDKGRGVVMVSAGKDSTALGELLHEAGLCLPCASEKDDLDYPGEEEHLALLAARWHVPITILRPAVSLQDWLRGQNLSASDDLHSRTAGLSRLGFYDLVDQHSADYEVVWLGLRKQESAARCVDRATHGPLYQRRSGQWRACPLIDWTGQDVLAYCVVRGVPLLPLYRCIAFQHREEPWLIRKSWWVPGKSSRWGGAAWLRHYYPGLFRRLCDLFPDARSLT